jgi:PKD repeat protein
MKKAVKLSAEALMVFMATMLIHACSKPTKACFTYAPDPVEAGSPVTFDATCSEMTSFCEWSFGDGTADTTCSERTIQHTFASPGTYAVKLHATRKDVNGFVLKGKPEMVKTIIVN